MLSLWRSWKRQRKVLPLAFGSWVLEGLLVQLYAVVIYKAWPVTSVWLMTMWCHTDAWSSGDSGPWLWNDKISRIPGVVTSATLVRMTYKCCIGQFEDKTQYIIGVSFQVRNRVHRARTKPILIKFVSVWMYQSHFSALHATFIPTRTTIGVL